MPIARAAFASLVALVLALLPAAPGAALAREDVRLGELRIAAGYGELVLSGLEIEGSSLPAAEIASLLAAPGGADAAERLRRLDARRARIPELRMEVRIGEPGTPIRADQTTVYFDVRMEDIRGGRIARMTIGRTTVDGILPRPPDAPLPGGVSGRLKGAAGLSTATGVDLAAFTRVLSDASPDADAPLDTLYETFDVEGYDFEFEGLWRMRIGHVGAGAFRMRPIGVSLFQGLMAQPMPKPGVEPSPEDVQRMLRFSASVLDVYDAFSLAGMEVRDIAFEPILADLPVSFRIGRLAISDFARARLGELSAEGIDASFAAPGSEARVRVGGLALRGLDYRATLAMIRSAVSATEQGAPLPPLRPDFTPVRIDGFFVSDYVLQARVPGPLADGPPQTVDLSLGRLSIEPRRWYGLVPVAMEGAFERLSIGLDPGNGTHAALLALGVGRLDLSGRIAYGLDIPAKRLRIEELALDWLGMGRLRAAGLVERLGLDVLSKDPIASELAIADVRLTELDLELGEAEGLIRALTTPQVAALGKTPEAARSELAAAASAMLPAILGPLPAADRLAAALGRFIVAPGRLTVAARSADGIGMADLADPQAALGRVEMKVRVNE